MNTENIAVSEWGADVQREERPGVPAETYPPRPIGNPDWSVPEQQRAGVATARSPLRKITPVYGTVCPPRGLSGVLRKAAYKIPDYNSRRWLLLMLADRIDVMEHNVRPVAWVFGLAALGFFTAKMLRSKPA